MNEILPDFRPIAEINRALFAAEKAWLFFDYDGTLADFAPTPADVLPDPDLIALLERCARHPRLRLAILSGRMLRQVQALVPVPGVCLAGTYGIELQLFDGTQLQQVELVSVRPTLEEVKIRFEELLHGKPGFYLEDKGWALAIHARFADPDAAERVLTQARQVASRQASPEIFRLLDGQRFFEVAPKMGNKGQAVSYLLDRYPWSGAACAYFGDDDKDEEAFAQIRARKGMTVLVADLPRPSFAEFRLDSPNAVRKWLRRFSDDWYAAFPLTE
ncbi:MAG TPA: trehalose-phosphatase [Anaerolineaceae bacterium]|nr:trehalose-phosphatase [Anaerolineaceae bacterium]